MELLQAVQNFAARIVSGTRKFDHVAPILKQLRPSNTGNIFVRLVAQHCCKATRLSDKLQGNVARLT